MDEDEKPQENECKLISPSVDGKSEIAPEENKKTQLKYKLIGPSVDGKSESENVLESCKNDQEALQRLQALLSEWLRMENLVVLTGAGCSVGCGGKTMDKLEKAVLDTVRKVPKLSDVAIRMISFENNTEKKETGFEQWLSYLVNSAYLIQETSSPISEVKWNNLNCNTDDITNLINYISKAIYAECTLKLPDKENIAPHLAFLSKLVARDSNLGRTHLFTLNYDTLFEQALDILGIQYFDGFSGRANAHFDPSVYGLDMYYPGELAEGRVRRFDKFLHFYKLHGSVHWRVEKDEIYARHNDLSEYEKYQNYQNEKDENKASQIFSDEKFAPDYKNFGILPTSNKFIQTLNMPYSHLFRSFQSRLSAPQTFLMVLGYGFGDEHVNRIIETALMNPALIMLVVEPNPESEIIGKISKYKELGKRAFVLTSNEEYQAQSDEEQHSSSAEAVGESHPSSAEADEKPMYATFDDFAKNILPDVQWLDDFLKLRRLEKQIENSNKP